jgi:hypothetical protein
MRQPVDFCDMLASRLRNLRQRPVEPYLCDPNWEAELHLQLGQLQPCAVVQAFWSLWDRVLAEMTSRGVKTGPMSYSGWNDGDPGLTRAIRCLIHHLAASQVIETGVAHWRSVAKPSSPATTIRSNPGIYNCIPFDPRIPRIRMLPLCRVPNVLSLDPSPPSAQHLGAGHSPPAKPFRMR